MGSCREACSAHRRVAVKSKRDREVNRANVGASSRRLSREIPVVVDKRRRVKEAMDL